MDPLRESAAVNDSGGVVPRTQSTDDESGPGALNAMEFALICVSVSFVLISILFVSIWCIRQKCKEKKKERLSTSENPGRAENLIVEAPGFPPVIANVMNAFPPPLVPFDPGQTKQPPGSFKSGELGDAPSLSSSLDGTVPTPWVDIRDGHPVVAVNPSTNHQDASDNGSHLGTSGATLSNNNLNNVLSSPQLPKLSYNIKLMDVDLDELGTGASGRVKEAIYVTPDKEVFHVAVKYARDASYNPAKLFRSELEIVSKIPHQNNIVHYLGGSIADKPDVDGFFIVMELMFTNLQAIIHGDMFQEGMSYRLILSISLDIINGLDHLHKYGIIHYDLKPSNVLLDEEFTAKLADFGSSKATLQSKTTASLRGTLGYIAPEVLLCQFLDHVQVSDKLDIYSMGVVMWEMVTREYPPEPLGSSRSSSVQTTLKTTRIEIVPCSLLSRHSFKQASDQRCPPSLTALIEDCLNFEPKLRPTTKDVKRRLLEMQANV